uniref:Ig-like domain-containing protein n=1 Tax=Denticeps clupeoides TaxID=299321 RepID=A0AAY4EYH8_9TELE
MIAFFFFLKVVEKHRTTFEFEVNEDDVEGRWLKNEEEINFSLQSRYSYAVIRKVHRMTITEVFRSDAGEYTFIAGKNRSTVTLHVNSDTYIYASLIDFFFYSVPEPPQIIRHMQPLSVEAGKPARFTIEVKGVPEPQVSWYKNSQALSPGFKFNSPDGSGFLKLMALQQQDSGLYICRASNAFGEASCTAELIVSIVTTVPASVKETVSEEKAVSSMDRLLSLASTAEEIKEIKGEHVAELPNVESNGSTKMEREKVSIMHLQVI